MLIPKLCAKLVAACLKEIGCTLKPKLYARLVKLSAAKIDYILSKTNYARLVKQVDTVKNAKWLLQKKNSKKGS